MKSNTPTHREKKNKAWSKTSWEARKAGYSWLGPPRQQLRIVDRHGYSRLHPKKEEKKKAEFNAPTNTWKSKTWDFTQVRDSCIKRKRRNIQNIIMEMPQVRVGLKPGPKSQSKKSGRLVGCINGEKKKKTILKG